MMQPQIAALLDGNEPLRNFLETGDMEFFNSDRNWQDWNDPAFREQLEPLLTEKLGKNVLESLKEPGFQSMKTLRTLQQSAFPMTDAAKKEIYAPALAYLKRQADRSGQLAAVPFSDEQKRILKPEWDELLQAHYPNALKVLPRDIFQSVRTTYANAAEQILEQAFGKRLRTGKLDKRDIVLLRNATDLYLLEHPDDEEKRKLREKLQEARYAEEGTAFKVAWDIIIILFVFAYLLFRFSACSSMLAG